jgi:hypothetical protein
LRLHTVCHQCVVASPLFTLGPANINLPASPPFPKGPGREILTSGLEALQRGRPDMNSLVGLGAAASFGVSCAAAAVPRLGWPTFFEEPAMLLGGWRARGAGAGRGRGQKSGFQGIFTAVGRTISLVCKCFAYVELL